MRLIQKEERQGYAADGKRMKLPKQFSEPPFVPTFDITCPTSAEQNKVGGNTVIHLWMMYHPKIYSEKFVSIIF